MYPDRKKKFQMDVIPTDPELWAIGMIVVKWSQIEGFASSLICGLADEGSPELHQFQTTWSGSDRLDQLRDLITQRIMSPWKEEFLNLIIEVRQVQDMRDKNVHGSGVAPYKKQALL